MNSGPGAPGGGVEAATKDRTRLRLPPRYRVLLHDDDFTTQDFVVEVLASIFAHPLEEAERIMLDVHLKGIGLAGVYPHELAEAKAAKVTARARASEFPLLCTIEPEESADSDGPDH